MSLPTLDEFIADADWPKNAYVEAPGFATFYVRRTRRILGGEWVNDVLDLANIEAENPGQGAFTEIVTHLLEQGLVVYVENVMFERFAKKLERMGFTRIDSPGVPSFFKLPKGT